MFFKHPLFMLATAKATFSVMRVAQREFPNVHGLHNKANAFRHALWNVFIAVDCHKFSKDLDKVLDWTQKFTDWHEEFAPNEPLAKAMDLQNNLIGRKRYKQLKNNDKKHWVTFFKEESSEAILITSLKEIEKYPNQLMYLED